MFFPNHSGFSECRWWKRRSNDVQKVCCKRVLGTSWEISQQSSVWCYMSFPLTAHWPYSKLSDVGLLKQRATCPKKKKKNPPCSNAFSFWMLRGVDTVYSLGNMITCYIEGFEALHERELSVVITLLVVLKSLFSNSATCSTNSLNVKRRERLSGVITKKMEQW